MAKSPPKSFKGWNLKEFLKGRKKLLITAIGTGVGYIATQNPAYAAICGAATELLIAIVEFYYKEVELPE